MAKKKTAKQLDTEVANALATYHLTTRPVYSRGAEMPTVGSYITTLSPLDGPDIQFKRETRALAIQAALAYADARKLEVEHRALVEAPLAASLAAENADMLARPAVPPKMQAALALAARNGGKVGTGAYGARAERVSPATIRALIARGLLIPTYGSEGEMAGELTAAGRALVR